MEKVSRELPLSVLQEYWGFRQFRPLQEEIIFSILSKKDTLALMPTGGGKSICYQVPALASTGLCLVISPLIALMKDQVSNLRKKGITAFAIYSGMGRNEVINTLKVSGNSNCKFLYVSPERLETNLFKEYLPGLNVSLIAVDEAHCISQWGYDFRPPYLRIAALRDELSGVPVLALTASATPEVQDDICEKLKFSDKNIFRQSFERPNLSYSVFKVDSKINKLFEIIGNVQGSAIVYCRSRKRAKEISDLLALQGISADYYHAGLTQEERNKKQEQWIENSTRVICCTNAFGMGIDKPDVRVVVHVDMPDSLENYYQESGRAGRDGKKAYAVLLHDAGDLKELEEQSVIRYPSLEEIRKVYQCIANYLQLPTGSGAGQYFDFDIGDFIKKFKLNPQSAVYSIKSLEQEGWLSYNEQLFLSSTIQFTCSKSALHEFEDTHADLEPTIKTLLRAYEGIFDFTVPVSETMLVKLLKKDLALVKKDLLQLHIMGMINYNFQKDTPRILIMRDRIKAEDLSLNMVEYNRRKEKFTERLKKMIGYTEENKVCRSQYIAKYFGDNQVPPCGICDNCLRQKNRDISKKEFEAISTQIHHLLKTRKIQSTQLINELSGIKKEKAWKVIEFMQTENRIIVDKAGWVSLK